MYSHTSQHIGQRRTSSPLVRRLLSILVSRSRHGKRLFFITSLYSHVVRIEQLRADAVSKLNELLGLARRVNALHLPMAFPDVVWQDTTIDSVLNEELLSTDISDEHAMLISKRVVDIAPGWIKYGREDDMVHDVFNLIRNGSRLAAAV